MSQDFVKSKTRGKSLWIILITTILGFLYSVVVLTISPKKYESSVVVELKSTGVQEETSGQTDLATFAGVITSGETMKEVAEALDLSSDWKMERDHVLMNLAQIVKVEPEEDSNFMRISVRHANPDTARDIANEIPFSYTKRLKKNRDAGFAKRVLKLDELILRKEDVLEEYFKDLGTIARSSGIDHVEARDLTLGMFQKAFQTLPESEKAERMVTVRKILEESEAARSAILLFRDERNQVELASTLPFEPLKIQTEAKRSYTASDPHITMGLAWGAGKGLVFGLVLALAAHFFLQSNKEDQEDSDPVRKKTPDPADVW